MNTRTQKTMSIILNIILFVMFFIFTIESKISYSLIGQWSENTIRWLAYASVYIGMAVPLLVVLALAMSFGYRRSEEYAKSIYIQFLPLAVYILTIILSILSQN